MGHCAFAYAVREKMVVNVMVFLLISNTNVSHYVSCTHYRLGYVDLGFGDGRGARGLMRDDSDT